MIKKFLITILMFSVLFSSAYASNTDWGLSYPKEGGTPKGNESVERLKELDAYFVGDSDSIYLTFDAGFENGETAAILDTLKENKVPAAFF